MYKSKNKMSFKKGMKRYVARRNRVNRPIDSDTIMVKCEAYEQITINAGATAPIFIPNTNNTFTNVLSLLQASQSFQESVVNYARYKITGIQVRASPGASLATMDAAFTNTAPTLSMAFYPALSNASLGIVPAYNDQKLFLDPCLTVPQSKYYKFPDNYLDNGSSGFGVWTSSSTSVQIGQFSCTLNTAATASAATALFNIRYTFYVLFSTKNK